MHILIAIISAVGAILFFVIRANNAAKAARELGETVSDIKNMHRRHKWRKSTKHDVFDDINDARLAAVVMMCVIALADGDLTEAQKGEIASQMNKMFGVKGKAAEEMLGQARWICGQGTNLSDSLRRASPQITQNCDDREINELGDALKAIAAIEGDASDLQTEAISRLLNNLGK